MNGFMQVVRRQRRLQILSMCCQAALSLGNILVCQVHLGSALVASPSSLLEPIARL